ncbi:MAG: efflux RND transporter permease subunit [Ruminococcus sp.]|nr:efflux RND transporter permease subunit [Ruminococcus sp.]
MLSRLSVKKPMTIFVAVIMVLVLGVVSFSKMTPDLMPNMDLPYAVVLTTYIGQTPETVETTVTKPTEQSLSVIDGVKQIRSASSDNYSMCMIEFQDGTNMNTATVDVRSALDVLSDNWPDAVGAPYLIKINPNILPVAMIAVDYEGKDRRELSEFVSDTLINRLEGVDGVASVNGKGILVEKENVVISQSKLDALNKKIQAALDSQFADAEDKIAAAKTELENNAAKAGDGGAVIADSMQSINDQQEALAQQLADAQKQADNGKSQMISAKMELLDQKTVLATTKQVLETTYKALLDIKTAYNDLIEQKNGLIDRLDSLRIINTDYTDTLARLADSTLSDEEKAYLNEALAAIDTRLEQFGIKKEALAATIAEIETALKNVDSSIEKVNDRLKELGTDTSMLDDTLKEVSDRIAKINEGIAQIDTAVKGLDDNTVTVNDALATIAQQQSSADFKLSGAVSTLASKQTEVSLAAAQLESAKGELDKSVAELTAKKDEAKKKADPNAMVTIENVSNILVAQNFSMPAGYVSDEDNNRYMVRVGDEVADEKELTSLPLFDTKIDGIGVIRLSDVADVFVADNAEKLYTKVDGRDGIILSFTKQSDIATAEVCDNINAEIKALEEEFKGLNFTTMYSQGDYIEIIVNSVLQNLLIGAVLAIIILLIFLRDIRPTIIVAVSIPVSVIFAIVLMYFSGITLNMISLSGLAIGVGMLVDNSVVVIENTYRLRRLGYSAVQAALNGARQVAGAIIASTLTTVCVFLPIVFVEGITRELFVDMALTITYSLAASLIVALTLVPAMSQRMLRKVKETKNKGEGKILKTYDRSLRFVLRHKIVAILIVIALLVGSGLLALARGFSFMPDMSSEQIQVTVQLDPNTTFDETVEVAEKVSDIMNEYNEFETVGVMLGNAAGAMGIAPSGMSGAQDDSGSLMAYGVLKGKYMKDGKSITKEIEEKLKDIDGKVTVGAGATSSMSSLIGDPVVQITLYGEDLNQLKITAEDMAKKLGELDSIKETENGVGATSPEIKVTVDRNKAAENGLTTAQVFQQVASAVAGEKTSTTLKTVSGKSIDVVTVKDEKQLITADKVGNITLKFTDTTTGEEKTVKLSSVAKIEKSDTLDTINRKDQKRYITIKGIVNDGHSLTEATNDAKSLFDDYKLPDGFSIDYEGSNKATMEAMEQLMLMLLLGVILIYLIMVAQFQSLKSPFIIMFTIPLAFTGGFVALLITGYDVSVISLIGFIMLCGIIVNNGIVLVDYINVLRLEGKERREAIVEAGKTRMRPIFITALTTVLGLSAMAFGIGTGSEMMQPLAIVCIGGLLYATLMTLFVIPIIYDAFNRKELRKIEDSELEAVEE